MKIIDRANLFLKVTKMTQQEFAAKLGVHPVALNRLLKGHAGKESIALKIDAFLDCNGFSHEAHITPIASRGERQNA